MKVIISNLEYKQVLKAISDYSEITGEKLEKPSKTMAERILTRRYKADFEEYAGYVVDELEKESDNAKDI